jgi:CheY-like chemotaxis protein
MEPQQTLDTTVRALIVEDDAITRGLNYFVLETHLQTQTRPFKIDEATSVGEAYDHIEALRKQQKNYDIVLLDFMLRGQHATELLLSCPNYADNTIIISGVHSDTIVGELQKIIPPEFNMPLIVQKDHETYDKLERCLQAILYLG